LGSKEGKAMRSGFLSLQQPKKFEHFGWVFNLVIGRLSYDETLILLKGVCFDCCFEVNADSAVREVCMATYRLQERKIT
jgi:hypothetical protein